MPAAGPAVFLDRDGVINEEVEYLAHPDELRLLPGVPRAIRMLNRANRPVLVVTNQSAVARGYIPEEQVGVIHTALSRLLARDGAHVDRYYYCPHHPEAGQGDYLQACNCRKPRPGMLLKARDDFDLDLSRAALVGDKVSDLGAARAVGAKAILVRTGYGEALSRAWPEPWQPDHVARDLEHAVLWLLDQH